MTAVFEIWWQDQTHTQIIHESVEDRRKHEEMGSSQGGTPAATSTSS